MERSEGDFARKYDSAVKGHSAYFVWLNRGKESFALDITRDDDLALLLLQLAKVGRDIRYIEQLRAQVRQVTLAQVLAAAQRHLAAASVVRAITHE